MRFVASATTFVACLLLAGVGNATIMRVDFDSLPTGEIDNGGATTAQLNAATTGGTWDLNSNPAVTHQIQADADGTANQGFSSRAGTGTWGAAVVLDNPVDISALSSDLIITFTSGTCDSTGFTRDTHWRLLDGSTEIVDIEMDDGEVLLNGSSIGSLYGASDPQRMGQTWDTSSPFLLDFSITMDSAGNVDLSVSDQGGGGSTDTVTGSTTISATADFDRLETSWFHARAAPNEMGVYFGEITIVPEPSTPLLASLGILGLGVYRWRRRRRA